MDCVGKAIHRLEEARNALVKARLDYEQIIKLSPSAGAGLELFESWKVAVRRHEELLALNEMRLQMSVDTVLWAWAEHHQGANNG